MTKRTLLFIFLGAMFVSSYAQITLEECLRDAKAHYPLIRQYGLIEQATQYSLENASKGYLPQFSISGKASYQSDATTLPFQLPGISFNGLPKDQYQVMAELQQSIWDGGNIRYKKLQTKAESEEQTRQIDVDMYALNDQVEQVFFGILLIEAQLAQNESLEKQLKDNLHNVEAYRRNGIANDADVDAVDVELLNTRQEREQLSAKNKAYRNMLSLLIGREIPENIKFSRPVSAEQSLTNDIDRPELRLFDAQTATLDTKFRSLQAGYMPKFNLFVQGASGNPGLNMLKDKFSAYYVAGVRLTWNFGSLYTLKNDKQTIETKRRQIDSNRELFLFNTRLQMAEQDGNIAALRKQMQTDEEIIRLRTNIRRSAEAKVSNGTLTVTEMLREVISENLARQTKNLHEIQLLMAEYKQKHLQGKSDPTAKE